MLNYLCESVITWHTLFSPIAQITFQTFSFARTIGNEVGVTTGNARTVNKI